MKSKTKSFKVSEDELSWLQLNISKLYKAKERSPKPIPMAENFGKSLETLHKKIVEKDPKRLALTRHESRSLQVFIEGRIKALDTKLIPGYTKRMEVNKDKYAPYRDRAQATMKMLQGLKDKL